MIVEEKMQNKSKRINRVKELMQFSASPFSVSSWSKVFYPFSLFVIIPFVLFSFYQIVIASPRFESNAKVIVQEPNSMATLDPTMALMSGIGIASSNTDIELVKSYILSNDMFLYLEDNLKFSEHFSNSDYDFFSRLSSEASAEDKLEFFLDIVSVEIDDKSQVITVQTQAFESNMSKKLSQSIVARAEWYINEISRGLAQKQLEFVLAEHALTQEKLRSAKAVLLDFQRRYNLLDPEAEGLALQQISYKLEAEIAGIKAELRTLSSSMSDTAPLVMQTKAQLDSLERQLEIERARLTQDINPTNDDSTKGVGQILAKFSDYKIDLELALQSYTSSLVSLEKSRVEAYRQIKYLVVVQGSTLPEDAKYPEVEYNLALFLAIQLMLFGIGKIVIATINELK